MRFFDTNVLYTLFGGTITASSGTGSLAFDEATRYGWTSSGEGTDGTYALLNNTPIAPKLINRVFVKESNIELDNNNLYMDVGSGLVKITADEIISSSDGTSHLYILNTPVNMARIRYGGENTIVPNQEKSIKQIYAFTELGRLENFNNITPSRERLQKISKLQAGKVDVIDFGRHFTFKLGLKAHYVEDDNDVIDMLLQQDVPMFIWINDNTESVMKMYQEPYRFQDIFKVSVQKKDIPKFTKNLFFSGIEESIDLVEVY